MSDVSKTYPNKKVALTSVLAAPITVFEFFWGKVLAAFIFTYAMLLLSVPIVVVGLLDKTGDVPPLSTFILALLIVPIWGLVVIEIMGAVYLFIGNVEVVRFLGLFVMTSILSATLTDEEVIINPIVLVIATLSGMAVAVIIPVLFARVSKPRLAK